MMQQTLHVNSSPAVAVIILYMLCNSPVYLVVTLDVHG